ncbi:MAG: hypothetical protein J6Z36_01635 [Clostridia bacterium]|nr:hypothetical protein [Clostridia bacterium]
MKELIMPFEGALERFAKNYSLKYLKQDFYNCFNKGWNYQTYSLYNSFGCFTIYYLPQRNEFDFVVSESISNNFDALINGKRINIYKYHKEVWEAREKFLFIKKNPFFYENINKVVATLIEIMEIEAKEKDEIFGIKI